MWSGHKWDDTLATLDLAEGYVAELVAAEPDVQQEPVFAVFDGDGVMHVAAMRSF